MENGPAALFRPVWQALSRFLGDFGGRAADGPIRTSYFMRIPNVGDRINPTVVAAVSGARVIRFDGRQKPHLIAIGSCMADATAKSQVWGTGVMHPDFGIGAVRASNIHALRGQLSHAAIRRAGAPVGDVPLGDPGYLAPKLLGIERSRTPRHRVGLVCHYVDRPNPIFRRMMEEADVADLNVHELPETFLEKMAECEVVVSSSLHGLIFAEAMNIPNLWVKAGDEIAGGDFKFNDWFSTTGRPQKAPHVLSPGDTANDLASEAELHESTIDAEGLMAAFPRHRLDSMRHSSKRTAISIGDCRTRPTPVFLISFNRGGMLQRTIASIRRLSRPTEIIVHDNGSTDPATRAVLDELDKDGVRVYRRSAISSSDELNKVGETVADFFADWCEPCRYVVSDCDVDLSVADPRALDIYDDLLNRFRKAGCVGPMLRIRDIPRSYPLYNQVMNRHIEQFWRQEPTIVETSFGKAAVLESLIDTTFAMHRAGEPFKRMKAGLRVYEPFEARHLDWYWDDASGRDSVYAESVCPKISHWNNDAAVEKFKGVELKYREYFAVRINSVGGLEVYLEQVMG